MPALLPGPRSHLPIGLLFEMRRDPLAFMTKLASHGPIARFKLGPQAVYFLNEPELVRALFVTHQKSFEKAGALRRAKVMMGEGLLTSEGELHARQRRLIQPAFHKQRIAAFAADMVGYAEAMGDRWQAEAPFDVWREMMHLTLAIVGKTLFSADVEAEAPEIEQAINALLDVFGLITLPYSNLLLKLPTPSNRRAAAARVKLDTLIYKLVAERRAGGPDPGDLLSMLIAARDEEAADGMGDVQVRDEAMTLFLAGHETTANALSWTWWLLSQNPEAEAALHAELDAVLGDRPPSFEDLPKLVVTERVLAESMRLYPPGWATGRKAVQDVDFEGYAIEKGAMVLVSQYVMHRDARFFPDPTRFDLDRWTPEAKAARPRFAYFPFGGGPRGCVGEPFAWMEGTLVLAALARRWKLRPVQATVVPQPLVTLRPWGGLPVVATRR